MIIEEATGIAASFTTDDAERLYVFDPAEYGDVGSILTTDNPGTTQDDFYIFANIGYTGGMSSQFVTVDCSLGLLVEFRLDVNSNARCDTAMEIICYSVDEQYANTITKAQTAALAKTEIGRTIYDNRRPNSPGSESTDVLKRVNVTYKPYSFRDVTGHAILFHVKGISSTLSTDLRVIAFVNDSLMLIG